MPDEGPSPQETTDTRARLDELMLRFRKEQGQHQQGWLQVQSQIPRRLHHYTTISGLRGIISSSSLWASDVRFMNDSSELAYAADVIDSVVSDLVANVTSDVLRAALPSRQGFANGFEYGARPFIACFCEKGDLLSQWRGYGVDQGGVSLGLDLSIVAQVGDLPSNTYLRKVVYDPEEQRAAVSAVVQTWLQTAESVLDSGHGLSPTDLFPYPAIWAIQEALLEHHLCFKNPAFAEEKEWRLIKLVDVREELRLLEDRRRDDMLAATRERMREMGVEMPAQSTAWSHASAEGIEIRFRQSALGLVPYVDLALRDRAGIFTGRLPLWQVVQGPSPNPELALESLSMYLESLGYGFHTDVKSSGIPLRR